MLSRRRSLPGSCQVAAHTIEKLGVAAWVDMYTSTYTYAFR